MHLVAVKGDDYECIPDTSNTPPPPPDPADPEDPDKYTVPPPPIDIFKVDSKKDSPDTGNETAFCNGKPVTFIGYVFSIFNGTAKTREYKLDDKGHLSENDETTSMVKEADVWTTEGSDFVYIDGVPMSYKECNIHCKGTRWAVIDGKLEPVGVAESDGYFTECKNHVYIES